MRRCGRCRKRLAGEGDQVSLQSHRFGCRFQALINLMEIAADAQEEPARSDRRQVIIAQAAVRVDQVLDAIRLSEKSPAIERVEVNLSGGGLITANEVPRQPNAGDRKPQPPREQDIHQAQVDGIARPPVHDAVKIAVFRVVIVLFVARKAEFAEEVLVDDSEDVLRFDGGTKPAPQFVRVTVQQCLVGLDVDERVIGLRKQPRARFEVEFLAVPEAKAEEMVVRRLPVEVENNLPRAPAQSGVVAHGVRPQPVSGRWAAGENLLPDRPVNERILIAQQAEQGNSLALRDFLTVMPRRNRIHTLTLHVSRT